MWGFAGLRAQRLTFNTNVIRKLQMAEGAINNLYVDTVDEDKLVEDAIRGMLRGLDPHSSYTTAKETESLTEPLEGSFEGIGVEFNMSGDTLLVIQTVAGGPSEKAGILAGDRIVSVNDTTIAGVKMRREEIMRRLRGKKGTTARLGIVRRGIAGELVFDVKRDRIPVTTVDAAYMLTPQIGYIRIGSFGMTTYDEFIRSVDSLRFRGMRDLVIDLQENGGGYLQSAVKIANEFLQNNDLIVYTEGRRSPRQEFRADGRGKLLDGRVAVLVNEYTASAAEILSGAIQDEDRGVIIGRRTFGKGLVQKPIEFGDGSMLRLTVSHYYTPSGRCIQKPYEKGDAEDYGMDLENRLRRGELYSADSINFADSLLYTTLRRGRPVYGGGGIMPDEFVPLDTAQLTYYHRQLAARGLVIGASLRYVDGNRKALKAEYAGADDFIARFETPESVVRGIFEEADTMGIKPRDADEQQATIPMLSLQLKALAARDLWDMTAYFRILNTASKAVERAVAILEEEEKE
ncbi:MAG: S41 family peptidase [Prevotella sp.]|nr:S41 family peptidase [Prevotella sp.]